MKLPSKILKAFTLVELLIVIVIIGILMSALLPRLQGAQDLARDTARQTALSQLQTAIMSYRSLKGKWPSMSSTNTKELSGLVNKGFMTELPTDPIELSYSGTTSDKSTASVNNTRDFLYFVVKKNNQASGAIVLATRVETDSRANYVSATDDNIELSGDFKDIYPCKTVEVDPNANPEVTSYTGADKECKVKNSAKLRYILKFS